MRDPLQFSVTMTKKSKVSASQIYLCVCILALLGAAFIVAVVSEHAPVFAAFKEKGVAAEATVTGKEIRVTESRTSKGKRRETKRHFLTVSYNGMSPTTHAAAVAGEPIKPGAHPTIISGDIQVATSEYEQLAIGSKTLVTYLPNDMFKPKLTASVQDYTPLWQMVAAGVLFGGGIWTAWMSWKRRQSKVPATAMAG